jgi:hypothetical protein
VQLGDVEAVVDAQGVRQVWVRGRLDAMGSKQGQQFRAGAGVDSRAARSAPLHCSK